MISIVDYGMGNLHSILKALHRIGEEADIIHHPAQILKAEKIILPGVGHFKNGMDRLRELGFIEPLNKKVLEEKIPILGICLGAQLLTDHSEEGNVQGLGWVPGNTIKFSFPRPDNLLKVPHIGWNQISGGRPDALLDGILETNFFYFVHSYFIQCRFQEHVVASTKYGANFHSVIRNGNIVGMQFHPEKSHASGLRIMKNFCNLPS
jgi:imidazole glycerol-phosphate synthase subunit HisH